LAVLLVSAAGSPPEAFVRPRGVSAGELVAVLADGRIDASESRGVAATAIFSALAAGAPVQALCRAAAGGRAFTLRVTVIPPAGSTAAPGSYSHPVDVAASAGSGGMLVRLANPGSSAPIATFRCAA
jgi:hypothetical protein